MEIASFRNLFVLQTFKKYATFFLILMEGNTKLSKALFNWRLEVPIFAILLIKHLLDLRAFAWLSSGCILS